MQILQSAYGVCTEKYLGQKKSDCNKRKMIAITIAKPT